MKLSIVICVYNTDVGYLDECLRSLTESTLAHPEVIGREDITYEIVMVDDGSRLYYGDLINKYGLRYIKTENRGIFAARTLGVSLADGDYIAFCDSDDTVSFNYHLPMLLAAERSGADIIINDWAFHTAKARYYCTMDTTVNDTFSLEGEAPLAGFLAQRGREHSYYVLWNKIYSAPLLKRATEEANAATEGIERYNYSEDALINFFAFKGAKRCENLHTGYYFYRIHDSQSVNVVKPETLERQVRLTTKTLSVMNEEVEGTEGAESYRAAIRDWGEYMARSHFSHAKSNGYEELYPLIKELYGVKRLRRAKYSDGRCYHKNRLLGNNHVDIDRALLALWLERGGEICIEKSSRYLKKTLAYMESVGIRVSEARTGKAIPREKISLKRRILLIPIVYRLGMLLFPKGSRLRAFLKKKI